MCQVGFFAYPCPFQASSTSLELFETIARTPRSISLGSCGAEKDERSARAKKMRDRHGQESWD